jgi:hypothetical protein
MLPMKIQLIWLSGFRGEGVFRAIIVSHWLISKNKIFSYETAQPNKSKFGRKHPWKVLYKKMSNLFRGPSNDAFFEISVHLGKRFQRRIFF